MIVEEHPRCTACGRPSQRHSTPRPRHDTPFFTAKSLLVQLLAVLLFCSSQLPTVTGDMTKRASPVDLTTVPTPPTFSHKPNPDVLYFVVHTTPARYGEVEAVSGHQGNAGNYVTSLKERHFRCEAKGLPPAEFSWTKNGDPFPLENDSRIRRISPTASSGSFLIRELQPEDAGIYQCSARNDNGTAIDKPVNFTQTYISQMERQEPETINLNLMQSYQKMCIAPPSQPAPYVFWLLKGDDSNFGSLNKTRISIVSEEDKGYIFFAYVDHEDEYIDPPYSYTCAAENLILSDYKFGAPFRLRIRDSRGDTQRRVIPPKLQYKSKSKVVIKRGEKLELHCIYSGFPVPQPKWYKNGKELVPDERKDRFNFEKSIRVLNVDVEDAGKYTCDLDGTTEDFVVAVESAPYFPTPKEEPPNRNSSDGENESFVCGVHGFPAPDIEFFKNGERIEPDGGRVVILDKKVLIIKDIRKSNESVDGDNAVYQCRATNKHGSIWTNFYLNILTIAPMVEKAPGRISAIADSREVVSCQVFGSPNPTVAWFHKPLKRGDKPRKWTELTNKRVYDNVVHANGSAELRIRKVEKHMAGDYRCVATNKEGSAQAEGKLTVMAPTKIIEGPQTHFASATPVVIAGSTVRLPCRVTHDPSLDVKQTWLVGKQELQPGDPSFHVLDDNTLVIKHSTTLESGRYTCRVETKLDWREETVHIVVKDVPQMPYRVHVDCVEHASGVRVSWSHMASNPQSEVQSFLIQWNPGFDRAEWHTYPSTVRPDPSKESKEHAGMFAGIEETVPVTPWGNYTFRVFARNEVGDSAPSPPSSPCSIPPAPPKMNPTNVYAKGNTPNDLVVYWQPLEKYQWNGPGMRYIVRYRPLGNTKWVEQNATNPYEDHWVIEAVEPFSEYEVQVQARNDLGISETPPKSVRGFSGQPTPTVTPQRFALKHIENAQAATFTWKPVDANAIVGEFYGYKIVHWHESSPTRRRRRSPPDHAQTAFFDADANEGTVYGLQPFAVNYAQIMVHSGGGVGPESPTLNFTMPEGRPAQLETLSAHTISPESISLMWTPPSQRNGILTGYNIEYQKILERSPDGSMTLEKDVTRATADGAHQSAYRFEKLHPDAEYYFTVRAKTSADAGQPRSTVGRTATQDMLKFTGEPLQPGFLLNGVSEDHINVTWVPGKFDVSSPKPVGEQFYFRYRPKGEVTWRAAHPEGKRLTVMIPNLLPGTSYQVKAVSVHATKDQPTPTSAESVIQEVVTAGESLGETTAGWLIAIIVALIIILTILIIVCLVVRNRGAKYAVSKYENKQGREPMLLKEERSFNDVQDKRSLTAIDSMLPPASDTDSMAEYGAEQEAGQFNEDGSFIGMYIQQQQAARATSIRDTSNAGGGVAPVAV